MKNSIVLLQGIKYESRVACVQWIVNIGNYKIFNYIQL